MKKVNVDKEINGSCGMEFRCDPRSEAFGSVRFEFRVAAAGLGQFVRRLFAVFTYYTRRNVGPPRRSFIRNRGSARENFISAGGVLWERAGSIYIANCGLI